MWLVARLTHRKPVPPPLSGFIGGLIHGAAG